MKTFFLPLFLIPFTIFAQRDWSTAEITSSEAGPGVYRLFVDNRVSVLVQTGEDGVLVVDAAYAQTGEKLKAAIEKLSDKPIRYLINTHLHGDHTGGNAIVGQGAQIIAHPSVKEYLSKDQVRGETTIPAPPVYARPDITLEGKMTLDFNGESIEILHLPGGHTTGDLLVYFAEAKVIHVGDLLFAGYFPYVDVSNGGNPLVYIKNVAWILENYPDDITFIGGHGPAFSKNQMREHLSALNETIEIVKNAKATGKTAEQMKDSRILKQWESFGAFFITEDIWIDTLYPFL
jgi:glyoxylase-like metal-dependent hydrolase (beta-lactamase superfamily II)